jgi:CubicO group peptidase (beta-lactamase class C family)
MWGGLDSLLQGAVDDGVVPGIAICVRTSTGVLHQVAMGQAELRPNPRPVTTDIPWDLASLTKVLATTPITMAMAASGVLDLDAPISETIAEAPSGVTAAHCLSHTSGLPPWRALFEVPAVRAVGWGTPSARAQVLSLARTTQVVAAPGRAYAYSDLGFLTLCALLERLGDAPIQTLFSTLVAAPSGVDLRWGWPGAAATEDCPLRGRVIVGEVHDMNAFAMGGHASHAGLFGSVGSVAALAAWQLRAWQGVADEGLTPSVVQRFWSHRAAGSHHLGWDGVSQTGSSAGPRWPRDGVGHLGFTGCGVWMAPRQNLIVSLVSNRVHPEIEGGAVPNAPIDRRYAAFKALRPRVHTAVIDALEAAGRWTD